MVVKAEKIFHCIIGMKQRQSGLIISLLHFEVEWFSQVQSVAGVIVLCSWARHFTLTVPLSIQVYIKLMAANMLGVNLAITQHPIQGEAEILLVTSRDTHQGYSPVVWAPGLKHIRPQAY